MSQPFEVPSSVLSHSGEGDQVTGHLQCGLPAWWPPDGKSCQVSPAQNSGNLTGKPQLNALRAAEDAEDAAEADAAMDEPGESVPWEQVKAELDL
jgi:hypothetical protein